MNCLTEQYPTFHFIERFGTIQMFVVILHPSSHSINNGYVQFSCIQQELNPWFTNYELGALTIQPWMLNKHHQHIHCIILV
jgi:hypothetical protein